MHRIAAPQHRFPLTTDRLHQRGKGLLHLVGTKPVDEREPAGFILGIQHLREVDQLSGGHGRSHFDTDRICDAPEVFHMGTIQCAGPFPDPREVGGKVVPSGPVRHPPGLCLLIMQEQPLMAGEEIDPVDVGHHLPCQRLHEPQGFPDRLNHPHVVRRMG